ncbi:MAG TPA: hypothetical protein G4O02_11170 [Caldilineae bacterium]|nr:hypothetical protein [Caldilineae bacterium]
MLAIRGTDERRLLIVLLVAFALLAAGYNFSNPLGEASDENSHFGVIRNYVLHGLLQGGRQHEAFQPPLYYLIGSIIARPFDLQEARLLRNRDFTAGDPTSAPNLFIHTAAEDWPYAPWVWAWHILRMYSTACVIVALVATWHLGRLICPREPAVALAATGLIVFAPGVLFIAAAVNNDNLTLMLAALTLRQCAILLRSPGSRHDHLLLGALLGAGFATKLSLLTLWIPTLFAMIHASRGDASSGLRRAFSRRLAWVVLGALATGAWWAIYQWRAYGDPTGWGRTLDMNLRRDLPLTLESWVRWLKGIWESYWLQWLHLRQPLWIYLALLAIPLVALLGWARLLRARPERLDVLWPGVFALALQCMAVLVAWIIWTIHIRGTAQARLGFPALPAAAVLMGIGLVMGWDRAGRPLAKGMVGALLALSIWTLLGILRPTYAPPPTEPADGTEPSIVFGGVLGLDYEVAVQRDPLRPGDEISIEMRWQALAPVGRDVWLQLKLQPVEGDPVIVDWGTPSAGWYATDRWPVGRIIRARHRMIVPQGVSPGTYRLIASMRPPLEDRWLPVAEHGQIIGEEVILAELRVVGGASP